MCRRLNNISIIFFSSFLRYRYKHQIIKLIAVYGSIPEILNIIYSKRSRPKLDGFESRITVDLDKNWFYTGKVLEKKTQFIPLL